MEEVYGFTRCRTGWVPTEPAEVQEKWRLSRNGTHQSHTVMSEMARLKFSFSRKLGGGEFLNVAVWPGRSNPAYLSLCLAAI